MEGLFFLALIAAATLVTIFMYWLVIDMAKARGHSAWLWFFVALIGSPLTSVILLWVFAPVRK